MPHFAELDNTLTVINVICVGDEYEGKDLKLCQDTHLTYRQTSYNTKGGVHYNPETGQPSDDQSKAFRKNFARIGDQYRVDIDAFVAPQPYPSWTLDTTTGSWKPPVAWNPDNGLQRWNEADQQWESADNGENEPL